MTAGEWRQNRVRAAEMLDNMSRMLISNEHFEMNDSFQLVFVHVHRPPVGTVMRKNYLLGHQSFQRLKEFKRSCIPMQEDEVQFCAVCTIVTARGIHHAGSNGNDPHSICIMATTKRALFIGAIIFFVTATINVSLLSVHSTTTCPSSTTDFLEFRWRRTALSPIPISSDN